MPFPNTTEVMTLYVGGSTPPVYSEDINELQQYLARVYQGTRSVIAVTVDGVGAAVVAPTAGRITASENVQAGAAVTAATSITAGTNITATAGNIKATAGNVELGNHLIVGGPVPTATVGGAGLAWGAGATATIVGHDCAHRLIMASGTTTSGTAGEVAEVTFGAHMGTNYPTIVISPGEDSSTATYGAVWTLRAVAFTSGGNYNRYKLYATSGALEDSKNYEFHVHVARRPA